MEGAESASMDLDKYLEKHVQLWSGLASLGTRNQERLWTVGNLWRKQGIATFDAKVKSADVDIHSSYGGAVESAPWHLIHTLSSLRAADGRIQKACTRTIKSQINES